MTFTKKEPDTNYSLSFDAEQDKLFGKNVSKTTAKTNATQIEDNLQTESIEDVIRLARAYEIGTTNSITRSNQRDLDINYYDPSHPIKSETTDYGLKQNLDKSLNIFKQLLNRVEAESDLHRAVTDKINSINEIQTKSDLTKYKPSVDKLRVTYDEYREHLFIEITKASSFKEFGENFQKDQEIAAKPNKHQTDPELQGLISKYNATIKVLKVLSPSEETNSNKKFGDIISKYSDLHKDPEVGGVIQKDRGLGDKIFNEAARILIMITTLGYKQDFMLLKSHGKTQHEEAEKLISPSPKR